MIIVREERSEDIEAVWMVNETAFGQPAEANIVDKLRENCRDLLSLVAVQNDAVVGHILFSPAKVEGERKTMLGMGLAPMAVLPAWQRQGIGTLLAQKGIEILKDRCGPFVIVLLGIWNIIHASALSGPRSTASAASGREFPTRLL
jgi:putative acetyltransferase